MKKNLLAEITVRTEYGMLFLRNSPAARGADYPDYWNWLVIADDEVIAVQVEPTEDSEYNCLVKIWNGPPDDSVGDHIYGGLFNIVDKRIMITVGSDPEGPAVQLKNGQTQVSIYRQRINEETFNFDFVFEI